ncbi:MULTISPECIES: ATP-binding cassette domain-containing protein [Bacillaceae]|uniref:ATP-binding cassette domain-containing protein n=1 Tax=Bacillaceae TaxID=186817 RepID=UPI000E7611B1|nr:ATP-binding cassette domain-containing protein [Bacillus sp. PK3_68]RJS59303.1 bacitracin ABC transporter ATP-binding protein [Bacillus sp. PK3_68]
MTYIIQTHQLTKRFTSELIINHVSMKVKKGEIYGFLGPNGSGKTTVMKMLLNLVKPSSGDIIIQNESIAATSYSYLKDIGSLIEYPIFYEDLTAQQNLQLHCAYIGYDDHRRLEKVLETVGLQQIEKKKVKEFSLGMRQRLAIARAIITKPKILILDEPINGLDPVGIKEVRELLVTLKKQYDMTILISSHIVAEIESIADTIGVLKDGKLIEEIAMPALREQHQPTTEIMVSDAGKAKQLLEEAFQAKVQIINATTLRLTKVNVKTADLTKHLILHGVDVERVEMVHQTLEEYFINRIKGGYTHAAFN